MDEYYGVFDYKESNTFRPTLEERIHKDYPYSKTLMCRDDSVAVMLNRGGGKSMDSLRIRKLTPRECFRLMGVKDQDIDNILKNQSDSSAYHLAGDSLITTIMMALFSQMLDINWEEHFNSEEWWNNGKSI